MSCNMLFVHLYIHMAIYISLSHSKAIQLIVSSMRCFDKQKYTIYQYQTIYAVILL